MQKRGTPVNRIPIMAKQVLDLYMLYMLVTEKGGLVEVINKKLWREITKGLNLPTSITSAAFTLRTQYMKYLYPYECEKRGLSNPNELQAAIDSNRREGRRQGFGSSLFTYSPGGTHGLLSSPKLPVPALGLASATNGGAIAPVQKIKKEEDAPIPISMPSRLPVSLAGHPVVAAQAAAVQVAAAAQAVALEQLREKLESGEPPEKKMALVTDEQQRLMQRALQQNLLAMTAQLPMSIRINSQGTRSPENRQDTSSSTANNGTNSISMSVEINGIVYTGVLFAQTPGPSSSSSSSSSSYSKGNGGSRGSGGDKGTNSSATGGSGSSMGSVPPAAPPAVPVPPPSSTSNNASP
ncbi:AT-rich interactive domain-containing protein 3A [Tympanuchus pallidicinctus]|uniref:AT-rich interactive domain-containing protein 3A n=1 Tax=Tympanuchus pallidicinctus TaxID=109042 RepID=UPI002287641F|nr:AT-rich interactive domain-containing protein 3A [Tympanuchus pallidicinctus]